MKERILTLLEDALPQIDFTGNALVDSGAMDSLSLVTAIGELSVEFGITIPYEEISPGNFNSLDAIVRLVERLTGGQGG